MTLVLKQSTQIKIRVGPFVDVGDGFTPETGITLSGADEAELLGPDGEATQSISSNTWAAVSGADGWYDLTLTAGQLDAIGEHVVVVQDDSVCLPVFVRFQVVEGAVYDNFFALNAVGPLTAAQVNAEADTALTDYDPATGAEVAALNDPTAAAIADAVWDEARSAHTTAGSYGETQNTVRSGTVDTASFTPTTTAFESDDITEATADHFIGRTIVFTSGALAWQATDITDYELSGANGKFTVTALTEAPGNNDTFIIV